VTVRAVTVTRRLARPDDAALLRKLYAESRPDLALLPPQTREVLLDMQFRAQQRQYSASYPQARREIIVADGTDVGQLVVDHGVDAVRIVDITVQHGRRSRGVGSTVLREIITQACLARHPVRLTVWSGNTAAQRLYARLGFVRCDNTPADAVGYVQMERTTTPERT
jgi:ribosomal protein S18 acetylase RimI-like enzyme